MKRKLTTKEAREFDRRRRDALRGLLGGEDGRLALELLGELVRPDVPSFTAYDPQGRVDTHRAAYVDGRKSLYFEILAIAEGDGEPDEAPALGSVARG